MTRPKVLVLLAAFNGSKWIVGQIETILNQVNVDVDVVISDDGSTDDTRAQIARFAHDERVRTISPPVPTGSAAQNFLWLIRNTSASDHEFICLADQDDIWHEEKLFRGCSALIDRGAGGYSCAVTAFWRDGRETTLRQVDRLTISDFMFEGAGQGCTFVFSASFYRLLHAFFLQNTSQTASLHYHDWAIYALSRSWNVGWIFDPKPMMRYRQHGGNDTGARESLSGIRRRFGLIRNGWYLRQLLTISEICFAAAAADPVIAEWHGLLNQPRRFVRKIRVFLFCLKGGRRRPTDKAILLLAILAGWV